MLKLISNYIYMQIISHCITYDENGEEDEFIETEDYKLYHECIRLELLLTETRRKYMLVKDNFNQKMIHTKNHNLTDQSEIQ